MLPAWLIIGALKERFGGQQEHHPVPLLCSPTVARHQRSRRLAWCCECCWSTLGQKTVQYQCVSCCGTSGGFEVLLGAFFFFSVCSCQHLHLLLSRAFSHHVSNWELQDTIWAVCHQKNQFLSVPSHHVLCKNSSDPVPSTLNQVFPLLSLQGST